MIPAASQPSPDTHVDVPTALREPAHQVSPQAIGFWTVVPAPQAAEVTSVTT